MAVNQEFASSSDGLSPARAAELFNDPLAVYLLSELARAAIREQRVINEGIRVRREVSELMNEEFIDPTFIDKLI